MKRWSFKLLDGKWAEWEEQEAENRCDKGQQELQEQTILHVQNRGNITNQRATLGWDCMFFLIFHLHSGWRCRKPLCRTLTQVTDSCNDRVTAWKRRSPGNSYTHTAVNIPPRVRAPFPNRSNVHNNLRKPERLQKGWGRFTFIYFFPRLADESNHVVSSPVITLCVSWDMNNQPRLKLWVHVNNRGTLGYIIPLWISSID